MILSYEHNKAVQADNSRAVRLVVSLSLNCTTRQTARELRLTAALCDEKSKNLTNTIRRAINDVRRTP